MSDSPASPLPRPPLEVVTQPDHYVVDGIKFPRTTHILNITPKPGLERWRGEVGNYAADQIMVAAQEFGHDFHEVAEDINRGYHGSRSWAPPPKFDAMARAYINWFSLHVAEVVAVEKFVFSERYGFAGTTDLIARLRDDTRLSVIDIKTSNKP